MITKPLLSAVFLIASLSLTGQQFDEFTCPVTQYGEDLKYPFTGGFHAPQFSKSDIDRDGIDDLFVYDRAGNVAMVFLYDGSGGSESYNFTRDYRLNFPDSLTSWAYMRDYNRDGISDIICSATYANQSAPQVYKGYLDNDGELKFEIKRIGKSPLDLPIIWHNTNGTWTNVYVSFVDQPEIIDLDADGDLDILSFEPSGSYVTYYQNRQEDEGLPKDSMKFIVADRCFGKFKEAGTNASVFLSDNSGECATRIKEDTIAQRGGGQHAGSTIMAYDRVGDGFHEIVIGDVDGNNLVHLENTGDNGIDLMTEVDYNFPSYNVPVKMDLYLAGFSLDVDGDGRKDMLVAPNSDLKIQNTENIWFYRNTGDEDRLFEFVQQDFLGEETIDLGRFSAPMFLDENGDGLQDLLVASAGYYSGTPTETRFLALYRNVGTSTQPAYELIDDDYLNFSELMDANRPSPSIGDLDNDGDMDLLILSNEGALFYYENIAGEGEPMEFDRYVTPYMGINGGTRGRPAIVDINGDGLNDIVIGENRPNVNNADPNDIYFGTIAYYENIGSSGNPIFNPDLTVSPNNPALGRMHAKLFVGNNQNTSSAPHFIEVGDELHAFLGSESGRIKRYLIDRTDTDKQYVLLDSLVAGIDEGDMSIITTSDIDNDGYLEMMLGNYRGGISAYNTDIESETSSTDMPSTISQLISIHPNLTTDKVTISSAPELGTIEFSIWDSSGRLVRNKSKDSSLDMSEFADGIYVFRFLTEKGYVVKKVTKI